MLEVMGLTFGATSPQDCATSFPQPAHSPMGFEAEFGDFWCKECLFPVFVDAPIPKVWMEQEESMGPWVLCVPPP